MTHTSDASGVYAPSSGAPQYFGQDTGACEFAAVVSTAALPYQPYWSAPLSSDDHITEQPGS